MTLNLNLLYVLWLEEYCQISPNKNKSPILWHVSSILVCCIFVYFKKALAPIFMALKSKIHLSATIEAWNNLEISKCVVVSFVSPILQSRRWRWANTVYVFVVTSPNVNSDFCKGGFYSKRADAFVISSNRQT